MPWPAPRCSCWATARAPRGPGPAPSRTRCPLAARAVYGLFAALAFAYAASMFAAQTWGAGTYQLVAGTAVLVGILSRPRWLRWDPTSLRTRLAVTLALVAAGPMVVLVAVAT